MSPEDFDHNDPLEARLRAMRPAELPAPLADSLDRAQPRRIHWLAFAVPLAAAAVWIIALLLGYRADTNPTADTASDDDRLQPSDLRVFVPIAEKSTLVEVQDLGLVETIPTRPIRVMRYTWIDDTTLQSDDGRSTMRRTQPRQQIVPVVLQVY